MDAPGRPADDAVIDRLSWYEKQNVPVPISSPLRRRFFMRPAFRYAAAVAAVAAILGLALVSGSGSVVLADVVKAAEKHSLVRYTMKQITEDKEGGNGETTSMVYVDLKAARSRSEAKVGEVTLVQIDDQPAGRRLMTNSKEKTATVFTYESKKPKSMLDHLRELQQKEGVISIKDKLDGRETVKYRLEEGGNSTSLWVDAKTKLPVRLEYEMVEPTPNIARNKFIMTDFEWDPMGQDPARLFSTKPPEGYTVKEEKLPAEKK
jgi:outer membrane lipoprotein-sorting protein